MASKSRDDKLTDGSTFTMQDLKMMDEKRVSEITGIAVQTLRNWRVQGGSDRIPFVRIGRRMVRYRLADIYQWEMNNRALSTSDC